MNAEIKERLTRKRLCEYILNGSENVRFDARPPEERYKDACGAIDKILNDNFECGGGGPEGDAVFAAVGEIEDAYFELGMQAGARTLAALLFD